jgi:MoaA/NifB/PqqE/SkfB family radical SAM enzyme
MHGSPRRTDTNWYITGGIRDMKRRKMKNRPFRALQIEVTSRCTRNCSICPRSSLGDIWQDGDLTQDLWEVIEPDLALAEHVHLQGWGEPLLQPRLPEWAAQARQAGCSVGITTNGDLLSEATPWLLDGNVNLIVISAAGSKESHTALRDGASIEEIMIKSEELSTTARKRKLKIEFKLSYLLTSSNAHELPDAVGMAAEAGFQELFVTHLDCTTSKFQLDESAFSEENVSNETIHYLEQAAKSARKKKLGFRGPTCTGVEVLACALNPVHFTYITWDGRVGPCVNLLLPVEGSIPRWTSDGVNHIAPLAYGRLDSSSLSDLIDSKERQLFITPLQKRLDADNKFRHEMNQEICELRILRGLEEARSERDKVLQNHPLPTACEACPKASGW